MDACNKMTHVVDTYWDVTFLSVPRWRTFLHWCRDKAAQSCSSRVERKVKERSSPAGHICDLLSCEILCRQCESNEVCAALVLSLFDLLWTFIQLLFCYDTKKLKVRNCATVAQYFAEW